MIAIDASVLCLTLYRNAGVPTDFETGLPIEHAKQRVDGLLKDAQEKKEIILIPAPALSEVLVIVAPDVQKYLDELSEQAYFKIVSFGERAAIEVALRTKEAIRKGKKRGGVKSAWDKVKYDRQIVAISKVEGASVIYSTDSDIHAHGAVWGIQVTNISELPVPAKQGELYEKTAATDAKSSEVSGSRNGPPRNKAGAEEDGIR